MRREVRKFPGYDCRAGNCRAPHPQKGQPDGPPDGRHGVHCDDWVYIVIADDDLTALSLTVFSGNFPSTVTDLWMREPHAADITLHPGFPVDRDELKDEAPGRPCSWVKGGRCYGLITSSLQADEFFKAHGVPQFEQPETFWTALKARFRDWDADARAARVDLDFERCPTCNGEGAHRKEKR